MAERAGNVIDFEPVVATLFAERVSSRLSGLEWKMGHNAHIWRKYIETILERAGKLRGKRDRNTEYTFYDPDGQIRSSEVPESITYHESHSLLSVSWNKAMRSADGFVYNIHTRLQTIGSIPSMQIIQYKINEKTLASLGVTTLEITSSPMATVQTIEEELRLPVEEALNHITQPI